MLKRCDISWYVPRYFYFCGTQPCQIEKTLKYNMFAFDRGYTRNSIKKYSDFSVLRISRNFRQTEDLTHASSCFFGLSKTKFTGVVNIETDGQKYSQTVSGSRICNINGGAMLADSTVITFQKVQAHYDFQIFRSNCSFSHYLVSVL